MIELVAKLFITTIESPLTITLHECSFSCQGYYCLCPHCIAGSRNESRQTRNMNLMCLSHKCDGNQDGQEVSEHTDGGNCNKGEYKESSSGPHKQKEEDVDDTASPARCMPDRESLPLTIIKEMEEMFLRIGFSQTVAMKLVGDQGIDSPLILASLSDEDITTICNVIRRPGGLVSRKLPDRGIQISILVVKN